LGERINEIDVKEISERNGIKRGSEMRRRERE
jgi:hypothetical protein